MIDRTDATVHALRRTLDETSIRAAVTASNLANVDTPGFVAKAVDFPAEFELATVELRQTAGRHLGRERPVGPRPLVADAPITHMRLDGNTVDVDSEMSALARLNGRFGTAAQMVRKRFALLRLAITDGRSG